MTVNCQYTIVVERPVARAGSQHHRFGRVCIEVAISGMSQGELHLGLMRQAAPDMKPTLDFYGIRSNLKVTRNGNALTHGFSDDPDDRDQVRLVVQVPGRSASPVIIRYHLNFDDLRELLRKAHSSEDGRTVLSMVYKDLVVSTEEFAILRGDVLFYLLRQDSTKLLVDPSYRLRLPEGWSFEINEQTKQDKYIEWSGCSGEQNSLSNRWFGIGASEFQLCLRGVELSASPTVSKPNPHKGSRRSRSSPEKFQWRVLSPACSHPTLPWPEVAELVSSRINYFLESFGVGPLSYLGPRPLYVFIVPYPKEVDRGSGGQYLRRSGTVYVYYTPDSREAFGHKLAHEYFHAYESALAYEQSIWFSEGYTELQGTLAHLMLRHEKTEDRVAAYRRIVSWAWQDTLDPPLSSLGFEDLLESDRYPRLIRGRAFLVCLIIALILEKGKPQREGVTGWFKSLLDHPWADLAGVCYPEIKSAALRNAGERKAELLGFFEEYVERGNPISRAQLENWLQSPNLRSLLTPVSKNP